MANKKTFEETKAILEKTVLSEHDILLIKRRLNGKNEELKEFILDNFNPAGYEITPEQTEKGIKWLNAHFFTARGSLRKGALEILTEEQIQIIKDFDHFDFPIFHEDFFPGFGTPIYHYKPVYRVYSKTGETFAYYMDGRFTIHIEELYE